MVVCGRVLQVRAGENFTCSPSAAGDSERLTANRCSHHIRMHNILNFTLNPERAGVRLLSGLGSGVRLTDLPSHAPPLCIVFNVLSVYLISSSVAFGKDVPNPEQPTRALLRLRRRPATCALYSKRFL